MKYVPAVLLALPALLFTVTGCGVSAQPWDGTGIVEEIHIDTPGNPADIPGSTGDQEEPEHYATIHSTSGDQTVKINPECYTELQVMIEGGNREVTHAFMVYECGKDSQ